MQRRSRVVLAILGGVVGCADPSAEGNDEADETDSSEESTSSDTGSDGESSTTDEGSETNETTAEADTSDDGDPVECPGFGGLAAGDHQRTIDHDGLSRAYTIHVAGGLDPELGAPLMLNLHGLTSNPIQQAQWSEMNATADPRGWITVYPTGTDNSWNAGFCCGDAQSNGVDDVGFLRAVVETLSLELCIDPSRVHATGLSNGGYMSHRLACEAADVFASVAPVASGLLVECDPIRPVAVLGFHGVQDPIVPYDGDLTSMNTWAEIDGCDPDPVPVPFDGGDLRTWTGCDAGVGVEFYTLDPMGHCWPGGFATYCLPFLGTHSDAVDANTVILDFFDQNPMP